MAAYPRANALLEAMPRESILRWLNEYPSGQLAMHALERKLRGGDNGRRNCGIKNTEATADR